MVFTLVTWLELTSNKNILELTQDNKNLKDLVNNEVQEFSRLYVSKKIIQESFVVVLFVVIEDTEKNCATMIKFPIPIFFQFRTP